jgi:hypothetical protein
MIDGHSITLPIVAKQKDQEVETPLSSEVANKAPRSGFLLPS